MSLFRIALRSIQQRGVASLLTMFSMALGVMLVVAVLAISGVVSQSFRNNASLGYNMIVGAKGGREQLTLNTVYYLSSPVENISYDYYLEFLDRAEREALLADSFRGRAHEQQAAALETQAALLGPTGMAGLAMRIALENLDTMEAKRLDIAGEGKYGGMTEFAIPLCLGDYYGRFRVVGTTPALFDDLVWDIDNGRKYEFADGRNFQHRSRENGYFEGVVGATVARELNVKVGDKISPAHGDPEGHTHERKFTIVGVLAPSGTPNDRAVFVNMEGFYLMEDHAKPLPEEPVAEGDEAPQLSDEDARTAALAAAKKRSEIERTADPDPLPVEQREVTAILLKTPTMVAPGLENAINEGRDAQAVLPVAVIYGMFEFFVSPIQWTLLLLTGMICVVSGISILVSIYNSMSERRHEIAVMRALGAGRGTVMSTILLESTLLSIGGGLLGWLMGHTMCLAASPWIEEQTGVRVGFYQLEPSIHILRVLGMQGSLAERFTMPVELVLLPALLLLAVIVGFWPAMTAYRTDVAESLGK